LKSHFSEDIPHLTLLPMWYLKNKITHHKKMIKFSHEHCQLSVVK
jgi:hypothetical protein